MELQNNVGGKSFERGDYFNYMVVGRVVQLDIDMGLRKIKKNKRISRRKTEVFPKKTLKMSKSKNNGLWTLQQNIKYYIFLQTNKDDFYFPDLQKNQTFFKLMSYNVRTRSAMQCRSHHQKMQKKYKTVQQIMNYVQSLCDYECIKQMKINDEYNRLVSDFKIQKSEITQQQKQLSLGIQNSGYDGYYVMPQCYEPLFELNSERKTRIIDQISITSVLQD